MTMSTLKMFTFSRLKRPIENVSEKEVANPSHLETFSKFNDSERKQKLRKFAFLEFLMDKLNADATGEFVEHY